MRTRWLSIIFALTLIVAGLPVSAQELTEDCAQRVTQVSDLLADVRFYLATDETELADETLAEARELLAPCVIAPPETRVGASGVGVIAYTAGDEIRLINADGTDERVIYSGNMPGGPSWSADGSRLAFTDSLLEVGVSFSIFAANADGTGLTRLSGEGVEAYNPSWSPDGTQVVVTSGDILQGDLYLIDVSSGDIEQLTTDELANDSPAWSPDGTQIAFDANGEIYVMDADGSNSVKLTTSSDQEYMPAWSPDGTQIVFISANDDQSVVQIMDRDGGNIRTVTSTDYQVRHPAFSPDGTRIVFVMLAEDGFDAIYTINVDGSDLQRVSPEEDIDFNAPAWAPASVMAEEFPPTPTPSPFPLPTFTPTPAAASANPLPIDLDFEIAPVDEAQIVFSSNRSLFAVRPDGTGLRTIVEDLPDAPNTPSPSPDGSLIAFALPSSAGRDSGLYIVSAFGGEAELVFTPETGFINDVDWSPDGSRFVISVDEADSTDLYLIEIATGEVTLIADAPANDLYYGADWSPDGTRIAFNDSYPSDLFVYDVNSGEIEQLTDTPDDQYAPTWSPDGTRILYASNGGRSYDLFTISYPEREITPLTVNTIGERVADWSPEGDYIFYIAEFEDTGTSLMIMPATGGEALLLAEDLTEYTPDPVWIGLAMMDPLVLPTRAPTAAPSPTAEPTAQPTAGGGFLGLGQPTAVPPTPTRQAGGFLGTGGGTAPTATPDG